MGNKDKLDGMCPAGRAAAVGTRVDEVITALQEVHADHGTFITVVADLKTKLNAFLAYAKASGIINATALGVGTTPENIASTAFQFLILGIPYAKGAVAAGTAFSAADTINTGAAAGKFWGVWLVQINASGTISTKSPAANQVYTTEALAIAALPAADAANIGIGYVTVQSKTNIDWVATIDDLTPGSDCEDSNFYNAASSVPATVTSSPPATLTAPAPSDL